MVGRLETICGPMFSGKTEELIRRLRRDQIAGRNVVVFKHDIDNRYDEKRHIISHNGSKMEAYVVDSAEQLKSISSSFDVVGVDEAQFFPEEIIPVLISLVSDRKKVICAGLDMTYRQEPFGIMSHLLSISEIATKLTAVCHRCGNEAYFTQRLVDGNPAPFEGPTVQVGALDSYEARCRECFESA